MRTRGLSAALTAVVTATLALTVLDPALAAPEPAVAVVCGYDNAGYTLNISQGDCGDINDAITNASVSAAPTTIEMMPGDYCPFAIGNGIQPLTIVGVGAAGISGGSFTGEEAALSTVTWDSTACAGITNGGAEINLPSGRYEGAGINPATVTIQNIAIDAAPSPGSGPTTGLFAQQGGNLVLRDVLFENAGATSLRYSVPTGDTTDSVTVENSAITGGGTGVWAQSADLRSNPVALINETTIDGASTGIKPDNADVTLTNVTVANGGTGIDLSDTNTKVKAANTIVGDNANDCDPVGPLNAFVWEGGGGVGSSTNLTGLTCFGVTHDASDILLTTSIAASTDNGGPTPSITPPSQAQGTADKTYCNSTGTDQREYTYTAGDACDIGAVNHTATNTPAAGTAAPSSWNFNTVLRGQQPQKAFTLTNTGGGTLGVSGVSFSSGSSDYSLTKDECTFASLVNAAGQSCEVDVKFAPSVVGTDDATLRFSTTGGNVDVAISGAGDVMSADPPNKPTGVNASAGDGFANLDWTAPSSGPNIATVTGYDTRYSTNGGTSWTAGPSAGASDSSTTVSSLTDGTSYIFEVAATSTVGPGAWSDPSNSVTPMPPAHNTTIAASHSNTIHYGRSVVVSSTLTDATTSSPLSGATVTLKSRRGTTGTFAVVSSPSTNSSGVVTATVKPKVNTQYEWVYAGAAGHNPVTSTITTIKVAQNVAATLKPTTIRHRHTVAVYGTVSPNENGKTVVLQRVVSRKWRNLSATKIHRQKLPNGKTVIGYVLHYKPTKKGVVLLRVSRGATATNAAGVSSSKKLRVT